MENYRGKVAICGRGSLGLITRGRKKRVYYPDGTAGMAYVGIHLTDKIACIGSPWSSRNPDIIGSIKKILDKFEKR